ncbi:MAG: hypothetical protein GAK29_03138 [Acinetobacter bereziniae]|uniref:Uncharacterized protein n=1 Tax=Acinetobacter bereziniae TaxID=106648 RepID=A0A833PE42_ACIBZ|nr:MAG: hypothetical protein GAK29_03138 [Acinetobacter bereziniae]
MDAIKFVKEFGWEKTKIIIEANPEWSVKSNGYIYGTKFMNSGTYISELKRLIESWELIQSYNGLDEAKEYRKRWFRLSAAFNHSKVNTYIIDQLDRLQEAIADVESVGIKFK